MRTWELLPAPDDVRHDERAMHDWLANVLESLTPRQAQVVRLYYGAQLNTDDIAQTLGIASATVRVHLVVARERIVNAAKRARRNR